MLRNDNRFKWIPYIALLVVVLVALAVLVPSGHAGSVLPGGASSRQASAFRELPRGVSFDAASGSVFHAHNSAGYATATRSGVRFMGAGGDILFEHVFSLDNIHLYANQGYFAVYEPRGSDVHVFSPSGLLYHRQLGGQILSASLNSSGASAFVVRSGAVYETLLFDRSGTPPPAASRIVHADENVFPISAAVSEDGQTAVVAMLDVGGVNVRSRLVFYHLNEHAARYSEGIFARLQLDDEVAGQLKFFADGSLAVFSDKSVRRISFTGGVVEESSALPLTNRLRSLVRTGGNGFAVILGDGLTTAESDRPGTVISYNNTLNERFRFNPDRNTTHIWANDTSVIIGAGRGIYAKTLDGRALWTYNATQDFTQVIMLENRDTILFAARTEARVLRRVTGLGL